MSGPRRCPECGRRVELLGTPGGELTHAECTAPDTCGWAGPERETDAAPADARLATLLDALDGVPVSDAERRSLAWLAGFEAHTVANVAAVIRRARGTDR